MVGGAILAIIVAACGGGASQAPATTAPTDAAPATEAAVTAAPDPMAALRRGRQGRGHPDHDRAARTTGATTAQEGVRSNVIDTFKASTAWPSTSSIPLAGSGDEIEAIKANKDNPGPQAPDVIDVGLAFGPSAKTEGLLHDLQGRDLGHHPGRRQGLPTALLVRRLLRRASPSR